MTTSRDVAVAAGAASPYRVPERGEGLAEYALMLVLIAVVVVVLLKVLTHH